MKNSSRGVGIGLIIVGVLFIGINIYMIQTSSWYLPKLLAVGIVSTSIGIGFSIFPGGYADINNTATFFKEKWKNSRSLDKLMWLVFTLIGGALAIWTFIYFDLNLV